VGAGTLTRWFTPSSENSNQIRRFGRQKTPTNGLAECKGLALPGDNYDDLSAIENGGDADGQSHTRDEADVIVKETRIGENCLESERLDAGARRERRTCGTVN
jgi:hypothetical protein